MLRWPVCWAIARRGDSFFDRLFVPRGSVNPARPGRTRGPARQAFFSLMELKIANFAGSLGTGSDLDLQGPARTHGTRAWGTHYFYGPVKLLREELCPLSPLPVLITAAEVTVHSCPEPPLDYSVSKFRPAWTQPVRSQGSRGESDNSCRGRGSQHPTARARQAGGVHTGPHKPAGILRLAWGVHLPPSLDICR